MLKDSHSCRYPVRGYGLRGVPHSGRPRTGGAMAHWTDDFFTGYWSVMQRSAPVADVAAEEARVLRKVLKLRKGSRVADVPCGHGRISLELARAGYSVVGVDACEPSIRRARRELRKAGLPGAFHLGDMRDLRLPREFNAVINWWGSFGYFDEGTNRRVLKGFADILLSGGRVLVDQVKGKKGGFDGQSGKAASRSGNERYQLHASRPHDRVYGQGGCLHREPAAAQVCQNRGLLG